VSGFERRKRRTSSQAEICGTGTSFCASKMGFRIF
jgi:hypothetical protein